MTFTHALSTNNYGTAKFIVSANAANGTHTTISAALTAASSGDTIFVSNGTFTENLTLKDGVSIVSMADDFSSGNTIIVGKCSLSSGTVNLSGITFKTNSDYAISITGSAPVFLNIVLCSIIGTNNTIILNSNSDASSVLTVYRSTLDLQTTGIAYYSGSMAGNILFDYCDMYNTGASTTQSTNSSGLVDHTLCSIRAPLACSGSGILGVVNSDMVISENVTAVTTAGTGSSALINSRIDSGTAVTVSIGAGTTVSAQECIIISTNTNAIDGAGTLSYIGCSFTNTAKISTTTQSGGLLKGGVAQAPSAGFIGERITSAVALSTVALVTATPANVTSISLTSGIWDVSGSIQFTPGATTANTYTQCSISTVSATNGTAGDNMFQGSLAVGSQNDGVASVPSYRLTLTTTTTVYLVAEAAFSVSTLAAGGRISATRVG